MAWPYLRKVATKPCSGAGTIAKFAEHLVSRLENLPNTHRVKKAWFVPVPVLLLQLLGIANHFEAVVHKSPWGRSRTHKHTSHPSTHISHDEDMRCLHLWVVHEDIKT